MTSARILRGDVRMKSLPCNELVELDNRNGQDWVCKPQILPQIPPGFDTDLSDNAQLWQYALNCVQDGVALIDGDFNVVSENETMECWYKNKLPIRGKKCYSAFHERKACCPNCPVEKAFLSKKVVCGDKDYTINGRELGKQKIFVVPIIDAHEKVCGAIEYIRDVSLIEQIKSELQNIRETMNILRNRNEILTNMLKQKDIEKSQYDESIKSRIEENIIPSLQVLKKNTQSSMLDEHIEFIESMIMQIENPIGTGLNSKFFNFTSRELQISQMIKEGRTSKEIAAELFISTKAVEFHRNNIRKKLGLTKSSVPNGNLRAFLMSL